MAIEEALTSLLSGVASGRRYWGFAPQGTTPDDGAFLVLNRVTGGRDYNMEGGSGFVESSFQIDCYAKTYTAAKGAARSVVSTLSGHSGTTAGTVIQGVFIEAERDLPATAPGETEELKRVSIDILVHHDE